MVTKKPSDPGVLCRAHDRKTCLFDGTEIVFPRALMLLLFFTFPQLSKSLTREIMTGEIKNALPKNFFKGGRLDYIDLQHSNYLLMAKKIHPTTKV